MNLGEEDSITDIRAAGGRQVYVFTREGDRQLTSRVWSYEVAPCF